MIQSPLNYTGGKYKLLPQILPLFPKDIDVFVDLFCGGCNGDDAPAPFGVLGPKGKIKGSACAGELLKAQ